MEILYDYPSSSLYKITRPLKRKKTTQQALHSRAGLVHVEEEKADILADIFHSPHEITYYDVHD